MKVIGYVRVSTIGQAKDGLGIPTQERLIRSWAKANRHELVRIVADNGVSGTLDEAARPGLLDALGSLGSKDADGLVVPGLDRLGRTLHVQEGVLNKAWSLGAQVFTVDGGEVLADDPDDPMRRALRQIIGVINELEKNMIVKRLRNGRATKAARGGRAVGAPPYGWRAKDGGLIEDPAEQAVIARMRELRAAGSNLLQTAETLNSVGMVCRRGRWHAGSVKRVLARGR